MLQVPGSFSGGSVLDYYLGTGGNDTNSGTSPGKPLGSLSDMADIISASNGVGFNVTVAKGHYVDTETATFVGPSSLNTFITGATPIAMNVLAITAVTGVAGAHLVTAQVDTNAGIVVGDVLILRNIVGASKLGTLYDGGWLITALPDAAHIQFAVSNWYSAPPTGAYTGAGEYLTTVFYFNGCTGISATALGGMSQCAIVGNKTVGTFGILSGPGTDVQVLPGTLRIGPDLAVLNFGDDGIRSEFGGNINAVDAHSSGNGNNGYLARGSGSNLILQNCISSGNGWQQEPGGGNGYLAQLDGHIEAGVLTAAGNWGAGYFGRTNGSFIAEIAGLCVANAVNYRCNGGFLQHLNGVGYFAAQDGFLAENNGYMIATNSQSFNSVGAGYSVHYGAIMDCTGSTANTSLANSFLSDGGQMIAQSTHSQAPTFNAYSCVNKGKIDASNSNSSGAGGTDYLAINQSLILAYTVVGGATMSPAPNVLSADGSFIDTIP